MTHPPPLLLPHQAETDSLKLKWVMHRGQIMDPVDYALMLEAWNHGTPAARDVALQMADIDRRRSAGESR